MVSGGHWLEHSRCQIFDYSRRKPTLEDHQWVDTRIEPLLVELDASVSGWRSIPSCIVLLRDKSDDLSLMTQHGQNFARAHSRYVMLSFTDIVRFMAEVTPQHLTLGTMILPYQRTHFFVEFEADKDNAPWACGSAAECRDEFRKLFNEYSEEENLRVFDHLASRNADQMWWCSQSATHLNLRLHVRTVPLQLSAWSNLMHGFRHWLEVRCSSISTTMDTSGKYVQLVLCRYACVPSFDPTCFKKKKHPESLSCELQHVINFNAYSGGHEMALAGHHDVGVNTPLISLPERGQTDSDSTIGEMQLLSSCPHLWIVQDWCDPTKRISLRNIDARDNDECLQLRHVSAKYASSSSHPVLIQMSRRAAAAVLCVLQHMLYEFDMVLIGLGREIDTSGEVRICGYFFVNTTNSSTSVKCLASVEACKLESCSRVHPSAKNGAIDQWASLHQQNGRYWFQTNGTLLTISCPNFKRRSLTLSSSAQLLLSEFHLRPMPRIQNSSDIQSTNDAETKTKSQSETELESESEGEGDDVVCASDNDCVGDDLGSLWVSQDDEPDVAVMLRSWESGFQDIENMASEVHQARLREFKYRYCHGQEGPWWTELKDSRNLDLSLPRIRSVEFQDMLTQELRQKANLPLRYALPGDGEHALNRCDDSGNDDSSDDEDFEEQHIGEAEERQADKKARHVKRLQRPVRDLQYHSRVRDRLQEDVDYWRMQPDCLLLDRARLGTDSPEEQTALFDLMFQKRLVLLKSEPRTGKSWVIENFLISLTNKLHAVGTNLKRTLQPLRILWVTHKIAYARGTKERLKTVQEGTDNVLRFVNYLDKKGPLGHFNQVLTSMESLHRLKCAQGTCPPFHIIVIDEWNSLASNICGQTMKGRRNENFQFLKVLGQQAFMMIAADQDTDVSHHTGRDCDPFWFMKIILAPNSVVANEDINKADNTRPRAHTDSRKRTVATPSLPSVSVDEQLIRMVHYMDYFAPKTKEEIEEVAMKKSQAQVSNAKPHLAGVNESPPQDDSESLNSPSASLIYNKTRPSCAPWSITQQNPFLIWNIRQTLSCDYLMYSKYDEWEQCLIDQLAAGKRYFVATLSREHVYRIVTVCVNHPKLKKLFRTGKLKYGVLTGKDSAKDKAEFTRASHVWQFDVFFYTPVIDKGVDFPVKQTEEPRYDGGFLYASDYTATVDQTLQLIWRIRQTKLRCVHVFMRTNPIHWAALPGTMEDISRSLEQRDKSTGRTVEDLEFATLANGRRILDSHPGSYNHLYVQIEWQINQSHKKFEELLKMRMIETGGRLWKASHPVNKPQQTILKKLKMQHNASKWNKLYNARELSEAAVQMLKRQMQCSRYETKENDAEEVMRYDIQVLYGQTFVWDLEHITVYSEYKVMLCFQRLCCQAAIGFNGLHQDHRRQLDEGSSEKQTLGCDALIAHEVQELLEACGFVAFCLKGVAVRPKHLAQLVRNNADVKLAQPQLPTEILDLAKKYSSIKTLDINDQNVNAVGDLFSDASVSLDSLARSFENDTSHRRLWIARLQRISPSFRKQVQLLFRNQQKRRSEKKLKLAAEMSESGRGTKKPQQPIIDNEAGKSADETSGENIARMLLKALHDVLVSTYLVKLIKTDGRRMYEKKTEGGVVPRDDNFKLSFSFWDNAGNRMKELLNQHASTSVEQMQKSKDEHYVRTISHCPRRERVFIHATNVRVDWRSSHEPPRVRVKNSKLSKDAKMAPSAVTTVAVVTMEASVLTLPGTSSANTSMQTCDFIKTLNDMETHDGMKTDEHVNKCLQTLHTSQSTQSVTLIHPIDEIYRDIDEDMDTANKDHSQIMQHESKVSRKRRHEDQEKEKDQAQVMNEMNQHYQLSTIPLPYVESDESHQPNPKRMRRNEQQLSTIPVPMVESAKTTTSTCTGETKIHMRAKYLIRDNLQHWNFSICKSTKHSTTFAKPHYATCDVPIYNDPSKVSRFRDQRKVMFRIDVGIYDAQERLIAAVEVHHPRPISDEKHQYFQDMGLVVLEVNATDVINAANYSISCQKVVKCKDCDRLKMTSGVWSYIIVT